MLICSEPAFLPTSLFATDFPIQSGYKFLDGMGGDDCCVSGQRIPVQRFDRLSSGAGGGTAGGAEYPPCQRSVLHQRQWKNPSDFGVRAVCASGRSFPGSGGPWDPRRANPDTGFPDGTNRGPYGAAGYGPPPAGYLREPGADGGASLLSAAGGRSVPITGCGSLAAAAPEIPGAAPTAAADPYGGRQRPAAQRKKRLGVD